MSKVVIKEKRRTSVEEEADEMNGQSVCRCELSGKANVNEIVIIQTREDRHLLPLSGTRRKPYLYLYSPSGKGRDVKPKSGWQLSC